VYVKSLGNVKPGPRRGTAAVPGAPGTG